MTIITVNGCAIDTLEPGWEKAAISTFYPFDFEKVKAWAIKTVNDIDTQSAEISNIVTATLPMAMRYPRNALLVKMWNDMGRPDPPDQFIFGAAYAEAAQFLPPKSAAELLAVWEESWMSMSSEPGGPARRWALERIKVAESVEAIEAILMQYASLINDFIKAE